MTVDETEPIVVQTPTESTQRRVDPWKIVACVSTAVSVVAITTMVWAVGKLPDEPTAAERMSAAAGVSTAPAVKPPAPAAPVAATQSAPAPAAVVEPSAPTAAERPAPAAAERPAPRSPFEQYFPVRSADPAPAPEGQPAGPAPLAAPWQPPPGVAWPNVPPPQVVLPPGSVPQLSIDAIIAAVSGTAGWVGGGTLDLIGDVIVASAANGGGGGTGAQEGLGLLMRPLSQLPPPQWPRELDVTKIPPPQWPRELDVTKIPPPQWPRELDVTKIPPPQWPRELDITKIPPPHVHWDRILPRF